MSKVCACPLALLGSGKNLQAVTQSKERRFTEPDRWPVRDAAAVPEVLVF